MPGNRRRHRPKGYVLGTGEMGRKAASSHTADTNILLYVNMDAGHGGASGRFDRLKVALSYGFALMVTESL